MFFFPHPPFCIRRKPRASTFSLEGASGRKWNIIIYSQYISWNSHSISYSVGKRWSVLLSFIAWILVFVSLIGCDFFQIKFESHERIAFGFFKRSSNSSEIEAGAESCINFREGEHNNFNLQDLFAQKVCMIIGVALLGLVTLYLILGRFGMVKHMNKQSAFLSVWSFIAVIMQAIALNFERNAICYESKWSDASYPPFRNFSECSVGKSHICGVIGTVMTAVVGIMLMFNACLTKTKEKSNSDKSSNQSRSITSTPTHTSLSPNTSGSVPIAGMHIFPGGMDSNTPSNATLPVTEMDIPADEENIDRYADDPVSSFTDAGIVSDHITPEKFTEDPVDLYLDAGKSHGCADDQVFFSPMPSPVMSPAMSDVRSTIRCSNESFVDDARPVRGGNESFAGDDLSVEEIGIGPRDDDLSLESESVGRSFDDMSFEGSSTTDSFRMSSNV